MGLFFNSVFTSHVARYTIHAMKYVICGNYGVKNIGDEWIGSGLELLIKEQDSKATIERMGLGTLLPFGVRSFCRSILNWKLWRKPLQVIKDCDVFVLGGGGLLTDEERPLTALFWALHAITAHLLGKRVVVAGVSIGKLSVLSSLALRYLMPRVSKSYFRDQYSVSKAKELGANNPQFCADFAVNYLQSISQNKQVVQDCKNYVLFVIRDYKNFDENKITIFAQLVDWLYLNNGLKSIFIPFDGHSNIDVLLLNKICDQIKNKSSFFIHSFIHNSHDLVSLFKNAKLVVAMRFHALIASLTFGVPFVSIEYMNKSKNFWTPWSQFSPKKLSLTDISLDLLESALTSGLKVRYQNDIDQLSNSYLALFKDKKVTF